MGNFEQIEKYLWGRMSQAERDSFEEMLVNDSDLALEVESQRLQIQAMALLEEDGWYTKMKHWREETNDESIREKGHSDSPSPQEIDISAAIKDTESKPVASKPSKKPFRWWLMATAASIVLVIGLWVTRLPTPLDLSIADNLHPVDFNSKSSSTEPVTSEIYQKLKEKFGLAFELLGNRKYEEAYLVFQELEQFIPENNYPYYLDNAEYNKALAALGMKEFSKAKELLEAIAAQKEHSLHGAAKKMLNEIEKLE